MKTNYFIHDEAYRRRKKQGNPGWAENYEQDIAVLEQVFAQDDIPHSGKLLEMGCGAGNISIWLAERGYEVHGVDISPTAIEWARENAAKSKHPIEFSVGSVLDLAEYPDDDFDFVVDGHCFHCIIADDRQRFLASALRVLKPQGSILVRTMCGGLRSEKMKENYDPESRCVFLDDVAVRYIGDSESIVQEVKAAGFHIAHRRVIPPADDDDQDELIVVATKP